MSDGGLKGVVKLKGGGQSVCDLRPAEQAPLAFSFLWLFLSFFFPRRKNYEVATEFFFIHT